MPYFSLRVRRFLAVFLVAFCFGFSATGNASEPARVTLKAPPPGDVVLTVKTPAGDKAFSAAELEALGTYEVRTKTFWPEDDGVYQGVLLSTLLRAAGIAHVPSVRVTASDGFAQVLPREDWDRWQALLATRRDGKLLGTQAKGPTRIIYPRDMNPELAKRRFEPRWVWMIKGIEPAGK